MSTRSSEPLAERHRVLAGLTTALLSIGLAFPAGYSLRSSAFLGRFLAGQVLAREIPDVMDDHSGLVRRTLACRQGNPSGNQEVYLAGSSAIGFAVHVPKLQSELCRRLADPRLRVGNFWAQNASVSDTLAWLRELPDRQPKFLVYGLYYKAIEPSRRRPFLQHLFPIDSAALLKTLFSAETRDGGRTWDPNGEVAATDRFWDARPWTPADGLGSLDRDLFPLDPIPNTETAALTDLAQLCRVRGIRLAIVRTPIHPAFLPAYRTRTHYADYDRVFRQLPDDVAVWNMEDCLPQADQFVNMQHTSAAGRLRFTTLLEARLIPWMTGNGRNAPMVEQGRWRADPRADPRAAPKLANNAGIGSAFSLSHRRLVRYP